MLIDTKINEIIITVKNYKKPRGLSYLMQNTPRSTDFMLKGPMGKDLGFYPRGVHVAYVAGTGILPFIDLIAFIVRKNLNLLRDFEKEMITEDFKLILHVAFRSRSESIAMSLIEMLA